MRVLRFLVSNTVESYANLLTTAFTGSMLPECQLFHALCLS